MLGAELSLWPRHVERPCAGATSSRSRDRDEHLDLGTSIPLCHDINTLQQLYDISTPHFVALSSIMSGASPSKAASPLSHPYTSLLSTLHERSSLLSAPSATIPPSLKRTLKRQIDTFANAVESASSSSPSTWREDAKAKWERVEEALERDEEGRKLLLAARDR